MKQNIVVITLLFFSIISYAQTDSGTNRGKYSVRNRTHINYEYEDILSECDIIHLLPQESDGNALSFWNHIIAENKELNKLFSKINTKGGSAKEAREKISELLYYDRPLLKKTGIDVPSLDSMKYVLLGDYDDVDDLFSIKMKDSEELNAFSTPDGEIFIYSGLLDHFFNGSEESIPCLYAILAHEFSHVFFRHALVSLYKKYKREKTNELIADIATGAANFSYSYSKARGIESPIDDVQEYSENVHEYANQQTTLYYFKYSRTQEYQSDIVAFRLLDWLGLNGEYVIEALQLINNPFDVGSDEYNDHPSTQDRIKLLKYLLSKKG